VRLPVKAPRLLRHGLVVALAGVCLACSADPQRARVWVDYERELVRLEASARHDERLALSARGLADPQLTADVRCRLRVEAARSLASLQRAGEARAELEAARAEATGPVCSERAALVSLALWPSPVEARAFLVAHPGSPSWVTVLGDLLSGLDAAGALGQLDDLVERTDDPAARCALRLELARRRQAHEPERALAILDDVAAAGCARSPGAAIEAVALLALLQRWSDVRARFDQATDEAVAWTACRALANAPDAYSRETDCLQSFAARFPASRKVDDAWYLLAERAEATGDLPTARTLYRRIVDERPDAGRAARARQRLEELR
jgi:hypothetical protein